tara:strand:+ start:14536 stop:15327 length:792 start_codon:yes stop_codon:yes gene_type:complete
MKEFYNKDLYNLINNKRVALVGPAPYLANNNIQIGGLIDNYDIICRVNTIVPPVNLRQYYGERTDIMFHNCGTPWMKDLNLKIERCPKNFENLKMAVCPVGRAQMADNIYNWPDDHVGDVVHNFSAVNKHNVPFYWIGIKEYKKIVHKFNGLEPTAGVCSIEILLNYPIKELFITGFSYYKPNHLRRSVSDMYYEGHNEQYVVDKILAGGAPFGHNDPQEYQIQSLREWCSLCGKKVCIDSHMSEILDINHVNILNLEGWQII